MKILSEIAKEALELSAPERLLLARILLDSSESQDGYSSEAEGAWDEEICRRMKAVQNGTAPSRSLDEVLSDLDKHRSS